MHLSHPIADRAEQPLNNSIGHCAKVKMLKNISAITAIKINMPQNLCVTMRSSRSLTVSWSTLRSVTTLCWIAASRV